MAADVSARVHLVAEKLQQKAQDAQRKGNETAARALAASVSDLRQALALISEQRHLLARRRAEGDEEEDEAAAHVQGLAERLARVEAMLGKKADDMSAKGNANAAAALQQSAVAVAQGRALLGEQQQTIFGLWGRWEELEDVVDARRGRRRSGSDGQEEDKETETPHGRLLAKVRRLVQLRGVVTEVFPECKELADVREQMEKLKHGETEAERLREELEAAKEGALEADERLQQESLALGELKREVERMKEREAVRQEEDAALLEQQRDACQAMEQLVRESDQEIQRMTQSAATQAEEMQSLRIEVESLAAEKERLVRAHADEVEELQGQLASAMDALSTKADVAAESSAEELQALQTQLESLTRDKEELVKAHADEVEELRLQLENAMAEVASDREHQSLQSKVDALASEKADLVSVHAEEVEEIQLAHSQEIEELRQNHERAVNDLSARKEESSVAIDAEGLQSLQANVDSLTLEKEDLAKSHSDQVEQLRKAYTDEVEELRRQLENATVSLSTKLDESDASNAEELQSLRDEVNNLISEKEHLAEVHGDELEKLRETHLAEIEDLRDSATAGLSAQMKEKSASNADELQQLRAEVGALTIEKDYLVKEHAYEIEKLNHQVESSKGEAESFSGEQNVYRTDNDEDVGINGESDNVPVMELDEDESQLVGIAAEDEVDASSNGGEDASGSKKTLEMQAALDDLQSQLAGYEERSQTQQDTISELEREQAELQEKIDILASDKVQTVDELQRAHEAEVLRLQADLQAQVAEYEERYQAQQSTMTSLENEQAEFQARIELLTNEKAHAVDELQNTHGEEATRLAQRVVNCESTIESLSVQLEGMKNELAEKSAEQRATANALKRCKAELRASRSELDSQILECTKLKNDLEAAQDAQDNQSGEVDKRLSDLTTELHEMAVALRSSGKMDAEAMQDFIGKMWQSQEVAELCSELAPLLTELVSTQDQLHTTEAQVESIRSEGANQKLIIDQFVESADWRLFAKQGQEEKEVVGMLASSKDVCEHLSTAKTNTLRWLEELQQLRDRIEKDTVKLSEVEQEKLQAQERLVTLEDSKRDLEVLMESLRVQLAAMRSEKEEMVKTAEILKARSHSASIQEQQQQVAQQEEVSELQQQLASVRNDFERYRVRSHTALKKMEKRAELLNGMRKENEALLKQVKESDEQREQADAACKDSEARLHEVLRTQEIVQADFDQYAMEKTRVIAELEEERQRWVSNREQTDVKIQGLTLKIQELEVEKKQIEVESERIKEAEQAAFQARLNTSTAAVQTAKQDLQKVHDALEASKAENDKRQRLIESLELKLEEQANAASTTGMSSAPPISQAPTAYVPQPSAEVTRNVAGLEKELHTLRASETTLRKQLDDARAELIALQERFATTKAANAEKVFALEEQSNHWKIELASVTEEVCRLNTVLEAQKSTAQANSNVSAATSVPAKDAQAAGASRQQPLEKVEASTTRVQELSEEVRELKTELQDANTEITLLTRALDASGEELQGARDQIDALAPPSSEPESGEDSTGVSKTAKVLAAKDEVLRKLRVQVLELQEEVQTVREEKSALELEQEKEELDELQTDRKHIQSKKERAMQLQRRQTLVSSFEKQVATIVDELQQRLEEHSSAFREVCDFRDAHRAALFSDSGEGENGSASNAGGHAGKPDFEECLVMRSGVVIKAGSSFQLPVICEKSGWRVEWSFSVKEEAADVSFKLSAMMADATSTEVGVVSPERMNDMSGVFQVRHDNTTLVFEWDNSFSWLNEKTLDYHVSIQEPLTPQAQKVRRSERELLTKAKLLEDGLALIQAEAQRRSELSATLQRLSECESTKGKHSSEFGARKTEVLEHKTRFQEEMDVQKAAFSAMLREQDELEDVERSITRAWQAAMAEREDVEMTLQLAGNGAQLETLAHEMKEQAQAVAEQLKNPKPVDDAVESSKDGEDNHNESKSTEVGDVEGAAPTQQSQEGSEGRAEDKQERSSQEKLPDDALTEVAE
ncbi:hypothetical protein PHYPSEUDO_009891 [Phytophthora pseudosyringae]|uniref:GOLD domain-containing protein n=1 Tax=Phytophthora pseudosyringae TaxID=221518 RepID=A0A8T1VER7_9STRA|nr:hypothetical protein PHYPSEUDO_009891 [Phytophthora pseudosyringae]